MSESATLIAARGWDDLADADAFYPDDLPADWRPTYYANVFGAVLLPWAAWSGVSASELAGCAAEVQRGFRFFLARPPGAAPPAAAAAAAAVGGRCGGWVIAATNETFEPGVGAAPPRAFDCTDATGRLTGAGAVLLPDGLHRDLRAGRDWWRGHLARHGVRPRLIVLARPATADLTAWQTLVAML